MITIGIDPGYERLGLAVIETNNGRRDTLLYSTCLTTPKTKPFHERLNLLANGIEKMLIKYEPDTLAIEELFFNGNQKTAMKVSEVRGAIIYLGAKAEATIVNLTPLQVKMAITGFGRASKTQVANMVGKLISIGTGRRNDDEFDAIAIALAGAAHARQILIHTPS